jgi:hypothetical protein
MDKSKEPDEVWETRSLQWIHRVRIDEHVARFGQRPCPLARSEAEDLARRYGLALAPPPVAER